MLKLIWLTDKLLDILISTHWEKIIDITKYI